MFGLLRRVARRLRRGIPRLAGRLVNVVQPRAHPPMQRLAGWDIPFPVGIEQEPTTACNAKCVFCPISKRPSDFQTIHVDAAVLDSVCAELQALPRDLEGYVQFVGLGEPTIDRNFEGNIKRLKGAVPDGFRVILNTNGTTLHSERVVNAILENVDSLTVSVNGFDERTYHLLNGIPGFEKTVEKVRGFLELKNAGGYRTPATRVQIMDSREYDCQAHEAFKAKLAEWVVDPDHFHLQQMMSLATVEDQIERVMSDTDRQREDAVDHDSIPCFQMRYNAFITASGDVYPCCIVGNLDGDEARRDTGLLLGNVRETKLGDIWNGPKRKALLEQDVSGRRPSFCSKCSALSIYGKSDWAGLFEHQERHYGGSGRRGRVRRVLERWAANAHSRGT